MGLQFGDAVGVAVNLEIEAPILIDACLPAVRGFVVLLGMQPRVAQVSDQEVDLLDERPLNRQGSIGQLLDGTLREVDIHRDFLDLDGLALRSLFFIKAAISAPLLNGPEYGPLSDSARLASRARRCWGVYSPSAVGNWERSITTWGVMTILLPIARTSTRSPSASPTAARTVLGMVIWPLCWTLTSVPIEIRFAGNPESPASCDVA